MILEKLKSLVSPSVDADIKLRGVSLFLGKTLDNFVERFDSLEKRQLLRGEKGDKGDSVTISDIEPILKKMHLEHMEMQKGDLREITARTWKTW